MTHLDYPPQPAPRPLSPNDIARSGLCIGCGNCVAQSKTPGVKMDFDAYGQYKPAAPAWWRHHRSLEMAHICPFSPSARDEDQLAAELFPDAAHRDTHTGRFQAAYVGYVATEDFRARGSSGGMVSWVLAELFRHNLIDAAAHVVASDDPQGENRLFRYRISRTDEEIRAGAKSRYYPVEMSGILDTIRKVPGRYAVVGVPCFIKAVQLLRRQDPALRERIAFTLGLFCGHMKSARMLESFAWQMGVDIQQVERAEFRIKDPNRPASWYTAQFTLRDGSVHQKDWWHLADGDWGSGFFQNSACNFCDDVVGETADISFGDAWVEPYSSDGNGTNVIIVRSSIVADLVTNAINENRLQLKPVDAAFIEQTQAAGFRQRREGLAYRLTWPRAGITPRKRVAPAASQPARRKLIYRMRAFITAWSHRLFWLARRTGRPQLFIRWAFAAVALYHGLAYSRGKVGEWLERVGLR